jgi:hypothetical protein
MGQSHRLCTERCLMVVADVMMVVDQPVPSDHWQCNLRRCESPFIEDGRAIGMVGQVNKLFIKGH